MIKIISECAGCATPQYPCVGDMCPLSHSKRYICDNCKEEVEKLYYGVSGRELCAECALEELEVVE